jgi:hypothetical protein
MTPLPNFLRNWFRRSLYISGQFTLLPALPAMIGHLAEFGSIIAQHKRHAARISE